MSKFSICRVYIRLFFISLHFWGGYLFPGNFFFVIFVALFYVSLKCVYSSVLRPYFILLIYFLSFSALHTSLAPFFFAASFIYLFNVCPSVHSASVFHPSHLHPSITRLHPSSYCLSPVSLLCCIFLTSLLPVYQSILCPSFIRPSVFSIHLWLRPFLTKVFITLCCCFQIS